MPSNRRVKRTGKAKTAYRASSRAMGTGIWHKRGPMTLLASHRPALCWVVFFLGYPLHPDLLLLCLTRIFVTTTSTCTCSSLHFPTNVTPPLLIVPCIIANYFRNSGSCDCFGLINCGIFPRKNQKIHQSLLFYSPDLVWLGLA